jgi:hypothetical protein
MTAAGVELAGEDERLRYYKITWADPPVTTDQGSITWADSPVTTDQGS